LDELEHEVVDAQGLLLVVEGPVVAGAAPTGDLRCHQPVRTRRLGVHTGHARLQALCTQKSGESAMGVEGVWVWRVSVEGVVYAQYFSRLH